MKCACTFRRAVPVSKTKRCRRSSLSCSICIVLALPEATVKSHIYIAKSVSRAPTLSLGIYRFVPLVFAAASNLSGMMHSSVCC